MSNQIVTNKQVSILDLTPLRDVHDNAIVLKPKGTAGASREITALVAESDTIQRVRAAGWVDVAPVAAASPPPPSPNKAVAAAPPPPPTPNPEPAAAPPHAAPTPPIAPPEPTLEMPQAEVEALVDKTRPEVAASAKPVRASRK